jgi:hypothetical protein
MSDAARISNYKKVVEFIPYKTLSMDLESVLANLTKIYVNRRDTDMIELVTQSQAELFPIGSFDAQAENYEYALQLAVPAGFFNHFKAGIEKIQKQLLDDISVITAPYIHEVICEVFVVIKIEQDSKWREDVFDLYMNSESMANVTPAVNFDIALFHAPADGGIAEEISAALSAKGCKVCLRPLTSAKEKDIHHLLKDFEKTCRFGVCIVSRSFMDLQFSPESIGQIVSYILNPGKRFYQIWDKVSRGDVADFNVSMARSLVYSTERMSVATICDYLTQVSGLKRT